LQKSGIIEAERSGKEDELDIRETIGDPGEVRPVRCPLSRALFFVLQRLYQIGPLSPASSENHQHKDNNQTPEGNALHSWANIWCQEAIHASNWEAIGAPDIHLQLESR
jgi:hypothetical protein